jgi:hypothetical protein
MATKRYGANEDVRVPRMPERSKMTAQAYDRAMENYNKAAARYQAYVEKCDALVAILRVAAAGKPWARTK